MHLVSSILGISIISIYQLDMLQHIFHNFYTRDIMPYVEKASAIVAEQALIIATIVITLVRIKQGLKRK
ncbi:hypothetical protein [Mycolicibacterium phage J1]|nr:hypothetical protein [Mycolicibacterium phage J1]